MMIKMTLGFMMALSTCLGAGMLWAAEEDAAKFRDNCAKQAAAGDSTAVAGKDGWLFLRSELRHIGAGPFWGEAAQKVSRATSPKNADPLPAIVDFNEQLKAMGIDLILMPVPCKAMIYPEKLDIAAADGRLDTVHQQFYRLLADKGVKVVDLGEVFLKEKANAGRLNLYCKTDTHWSPFGCEVAAREIRKMIGSPAWLHAAPDKFKTTKDARVITGDLAEGKGTEELPARIVQAEVAALEDKSSPIVLLGDSHTRVFHSGGDMQGTRAGLADQLAVELGLAVDVVPCQGSGATSARVNLMQRAKANPAYLPGKKLVIWCLTARDFTESSGWALIKLSPGK